MFSRFSLDSLVISFRNAFLVYSWFGGIKLVSYCDSILEEQGSCNIRWKHWNKNNNIKNKYFLMFLESHLQRAVVNCKSKSTGWKNPVCIFWRAYCNQDEMDQLFLLSNTSQGEHTNILMRKILNITLFCWLDKHNKHIQKCVCHLKIYDIR